MSQRPLSPKIYLEEAQRGLIFLSKILFHLDAQHQGEKSMNGINEYVAESAGVMSLGEQQGREVQRGEGSRLWH